jgi:hypothetical protein
MDLRFFIDPRTDEPHIHRHGVDEDEVREALAAALEDRQGREGSRVAIGVTESGRFLRVIYIPGLGDEQAFVITAMELGPKALKALRRRLRRRS